MARAGALVARQAPRARPAAPGAAMRVAARGAVSCACGRLAAAALAHRHGLRGRRARPGRGASAGPGPRWPPHLPPPPPPPAGAAAPAGQARGAAHLLGLALDGRDIFARLARGARVSLIVCSVAPLIGLVFGSALGLLAAYYGGVLRTVILALLDAM